LFYHFHKARKREAGLSVSINYRVAVTSMWRSYIKTAYSSLE